MIKTSIAYWHLQFELTVLHHTHWSQLDSDGWYINQSLPKGTLHREQLYIQSEDRFSFIIPSYSIQSQSRLKQQRQK